MTLNFRYKSIFLLLIICTTLLSGYAYSQETLSQPLKKEGAALPGHKEMGCMACHKTTPESLDPKDKTELIDTNIDSLCRRCHNLVAVVRETHHLEPTPYQEAELIAELERLGLPLSKGAPTCITCHNPHGIPAEDFFLNNTYLDFATASKKINPHWNEKMCVACHLKKPAGSNELYFKYNSDFIKLCNSCHELISSQNLIHSVGMVPEPKIKAKMPKNFKLNEHGEVVCITCHELKYQCLKEEYQRKVLNPLFFRGGPYKSRTDLCYKCHDPSDYSRLNPHDMISDEGEILTDKCLYCHSEVPDAKIADDISKVKFVLKSNLKGLCQRCHRPMPHPGGWLARATFDHNNVKPSKKAFEWKMNSEKKKGVILPLEPGSGKIFCGTCHNPHERGVILNVKGDRGSDDKQRLRLSYGFDLCATCHGWNK